jgi:hypothetical protein
MSKVFLIISLKRLSSARAERKRERERAAQEQRIKVVKSIL